MNENFLFEPFVTHQKDAKCVYLRLIELCSTFLHGIFLKAGEMVKCHLIYALFFAAKDGEKKS